MLEDCGGFYTTDKYWDCDCEHNYIHPKSQRECPVCGATSEDNPDARAKEVIEQLGVSVDDL